MSERYALILGAMKAGTTALYNALSRHPGFAPCGEKEPAYWVLDESRGRGMEGYRKLWTEAAGDGRWRLEGSTEYTKMPVRPSAAPFLAKQDAEFRFIYLTRNPVRRIRSQYSHALAEGWLQKPIHEELHPRTVWFSNYRVQLQPYIDFFGRYSILVMSHEELTHKPTASLKRVCEFFELDPSLMSMELPRANDSVYYRTINLRRCLEAFGLADPTPPGQSARWIAEPTLLGEARRRADALGRPELVDAARAEVEREVSPSPEQEAHIQEALEEDLRRFEDTWGLDPWTGQRSSSGSEPGHDHLVRPEQGSVTTR